MTRQILIIIGGTIAAMALLAALTVLQQSEREKEKPSSDQIENFQDCAEAGYPVQESYPRQCRTPDGRVFTEEIDDNGESYGTPEADICVNHCGNGQCDEIVCLGTGCPCAENLVSCPDDCFVAPQPPSPPEASSCCSNEQLRAGYVCMPACGPPVVGDNDPPPGNICLSSEAAESRKKFGCPICLAGDTFIATPQGDISVRALLEGMVVWTTDSSGARIQAPLVRVAKTPVLRTHHVVHLVLADGRKVRASYQHPTADGRIVGELASGDILDGSRVVQALFKPYKEDATYDILPAGTTGAYWANGILLESTLARQTFPSH